MNESGLNFLLFFYRLRHGVRAVEHEDRDLLVGLLADIHRTMNTGARLLPLDLSRRNPHAMALSSIPVLDQEHISAQHHCHSLKWIAMPRHSLAGSKAQTPHHRGSIVEDDFVCHFWSSSVPQFSAHPPLAAASFRQRFRRRCHSPCTR
jgi:hypothetical protein